MKGGFKQMHSIVTGASGFLGAALCRELLDQGGYVTAVLRPDSPNKEKIMRMSHERSGCQSRLEVVETRLDRLEDLWKVHHIRADVFYHLAWNGSAGPAREDFDIQYTNIGYTAQAVRTAKECGCRKFVGAGSQAEYGVIHRKAVEAETVPHPFMMYGAAKLASYQMGRVLAGQLGISFVWPRIYSVYGVGENSGTLVNYVMDSLRAGKMPELTPCENMWNFMYVSDCAKALRMLGESGESEGIYHVASKDTRRLREFVEEIRDIAAPGAEIGFGKKEAQAERTFWLEPDVGRLDETGFACEVSFEDGIRRKEGWGRSCGFPRS